MQRREKGTGTIIKTETGYKGKIDIGRGTDGKRKFKCFSGKTEAEVKRKIREYNKSGAPTNPQQIYGHASGSQGSHYGESRLSKRM